MKFRERVEDFIRHLARARATFVICRRGQRQDREFAPHLKWNGAGQRRERTNRQCLRRFALFQ